MEGKVPIKTLKGFPSATALISRAIKKALTCRGGGHETGRSGYF
jgi:hypothetical protein